MIIDSTHIDHDPPWKYAITRNYGYQYPNFECWLIEGKYKTIPAVLQAMDYWKGQGKTPVRIEHVYYESISHEQNNSQIPRPTFMPNLQKAIKKLADACKGIRLHRMHGE